MNCHLPPKAGPCNRHHKRYYYNATLGKCHHFNYSGCEGNNNNFDSLLSCEDSCSEASKVKDNQVKEKCKMSKDSGK